MVKKLEKGKGLVELGPTKKYAILIPAGTYHNITKSQTQPRVEFFSTPSLLKKYILSNILEE